jgi:Polyketide cyclase / dehydrase and lipid transport
MQEPNSSPISWSARVALLLCVSATSITAVVNTAWTDAGMKNGVTLAFRDDPVLALREVRATADLPFLAKQIFSLVCDLSKYQAVVPGVQEARLLGGEVPADYEVYLRYAPRFMVVASRDVVLRVQSRAGDAGAFGCQWSELADRLPERNGSVRMPLLRGTWTIEARDTASSRVVYQVAAKPGGRLPGWLVRRGSVNALAEVIEQVKRCLERASSGSRRDSVSCPDTTNPGD